MSRGGVIRLLDQIRLNLFPYFNCGQILAILTGLVHPTHASQQVWQWKVKTSICKRVEIGRSNAIGDTKIFPVVPIGGAIVRPR